MISEQTINTISKYRKNKTALILISNKWKETVKYHIVYKRVDNINEHVHYRLCIAHAQFYKLDEKHCERVYSLNLSLAGLTNIPEKVWMMTQLRILDMSGDLLQKLPENIGQLVRLQKLYLSHNQLKELPESINQLVQLQHLYLSNNQLQKLPESINQLVQLQLLSLSNNQLKELPESIGQLVQLQELYLNNNQLQNLPESITNNKKIEIRRWKN